MTVTESTISGNGRPILGAGILNESTSGHNATTTVLSSTLESNTAANGGAIANRSAGGEARLSLDRNTLTGNTASENGGAIANSVLAGGTACLSLVRSVLSDNDSDLLARGLPTKRPMAAGQGDRYAQPV
ncbi:MAG: hypothetical protein R3C44_14655 [Chloroflexota bacterium]